MWQNPPRHSAEADAVAVALTPTADRHAVVVFEVTLRVKVHWV